MACLSDLNALTSRVSCQLKAKAGAREMSERLSETKIETREEKKALTAKVAQESAGIVQGLMPAMMMPKK